MTLFTYCFPYYLKFDQDPFLKVLRDGQWQEEDASILVPGDIISIKLGDIIPADARLLEGDPLKIDQARPEYCSIYLPLFSFSVLCQDFL